ncbi:MAG TPA: CHAT domain-containing protein [Accumulibacter sp.]|nr:CHAT domain-containing protein [Accumulibacter sp.]
MSDCRAPVSLSICYALLVGGEDAQSLLGPVGFGPLLRARGAPWVIGPLWQSNMRASALFYDVFHAERPAHGPQAALEQATRHLRTLGYRPLADWAQAQGGAMPAIVARWSEYMRAQGHAQPFAHPAYWAQFSLLGPR